MPSGHAQFDFFIRTGDRCVMQMLQIDNVALMRGARVVTARLNATLDAGGILLLRGANGSGKSTLLRALAGFLPPLTGAMRWDAGMPPPCHYLGHRDGLDDALTTAEQLAHDAALFGAMNGAIARAQTLFDLTPLLDLRVAQLSAGQRRRLALTRLMLAPRVLWLLDEPMAALDRAGQDVLRAAIALHRQGGGAVVMALHEPWDDAEAPILEMTPCAMP